MPGSWLRGNISIAPAQRLSRDGGIVKFFFAGLACQGKWQRRPPPETCPDSISDPYIPTPPIWPLRSLRRGSRTSGRRVESVERSQPRVCKFYLGNNCSRGGNIVLWCETKSRFPPVKRKWSKGKERDAGRNWYPLIGKAVMKDITLRSGRFHIWHLQRKITLFAECQGA